MTAPVVFGAVSRMSEGSSGNIGDASAGDGVRPGNETTSATLVDRKPFTPSSDVGAVVSKAKKAAASLCIILHAQRCNESPYRCPVRGCAESKIVLLHIKTCKACGGEECPKEFQGCCQTRKLLAHYDQCREIRARQNRHKQALKPSGRQQQQHVCLVCSLMARHARGILEGSRSSSGGKARRGGSAFTLSKQKSSSETTTVVIPAQLIRSSSVKSMPPPPCRRPQDTTEGLEDSMFSTSLPSSSELMSGKISAVAAATECQATPGGLVVQSMLGKSLDSTSTYMDKMAALLNATRDDNIARVQGEVSRRSRAESCDETSTFKPKQNRSILVPQDFVGNQNDPTVESLLTSENDQESGVLLSRRRRSASLGVLVEGASRCATILEEESDPQLNDVENEEVFQMDD